MSLDLSVIAPRTERDIEAQKLRTKLRNVQRRRSELRLQQARLRAQLLDIELEPSAPARIAAWQRVAELARS